jgi:uncharacterized protein (TIGR02246 family)
MRPSLILLLALSLPVPPLALRAEEPSPEIAGLEQAAADFVIAFNAKDSEAIAKLFLENGEISDDGDGSIISGREQIAAHYAGLFAGENVPSLAIEVDSVRLVAPNLAIEDGTAHFTDAEGDAPPRSTAYTAVLMKNGDQAWQIASTRSLRDVTEDAGRLADLAATINGDWTTLNEGVRLDLAFGWDETGNFITGEMLTTTADGEPQPGTIRISWDAAKQSIVSWIFDAEGGVSEGIWTPTEDGWLIRSEGTTGDGEILGASQSLTTEGPNTLLWTATHRVVDGEVQPDNLLRIVRQAPEPSAN